MVQMLSRYTRHGFPNATLSDGTSLVTTLPAPMTTLSPMVTPGRTIAPPPIQTLSPMVMGAVMVLQNEKDLSAVGIPNRSVAFVGWYAVICCTPGAMRALSPILMTLSSRNSPC